MKDLVYWIGRKWPLLIGFVAIVTVANMVARGVPADRLTLPLIAAGICFAVHEFQVERSPLRFLLCAALVLLPWWLG